MRGVPNDRAILNPERLWRLMSHAGDLRDAQGGRPLIDHVQPERVDLRVSLAEAAIFKEGTRTDRTARRVLEQQEALRCEKGMKVSVFRKLGDSHEGGRCKRRAWRGIE
jgi:hypothetical protein